MAKTTNFNKDLLAQAAADLVRVNTTSTSSTALKNKDEAGEINSDISGLDDKNGGWSFVSTEVSNVGTSVSQYVGLLQTAVQQVHSAMQASIGTLTQADTDSKTGVNSTGVDSATHSQSGQT
jgi:hypothetical protein